MRIKEYVIFELEEVDENGPHLNKTQSKPITSGKHSSLDLPTYD